MSRSVTVTAPSRIHFGLMSFGGAAGRQFGGVGLMIDRPGLLVWFKAAREFSTKGLLANRIETFARRWQAYHRLEALPECAIEVPLAPREHIGLGVGTQLAMSVAAGLSRFIGLPQQTPLELASSVGRGHRSAVGAYGFVLGGLIAERGKLPGEPVSPLDCHLHLPEAWRVLLVCPRHVAGLASDEEVKAFANLPPVPDEVTARLATIARDQLLPAAAQGDFAAFASAVYEYGRLSGECFAALQGGPYNGARLAALVRMLQRLGVVGVGQSSWGPTIFGILANPLEATRVCEALMDCEEAQECDVVVSEISRVGATITVH